MQERCTVEVELPSDQFNEPVERVVALDDAELQLVVGGGPNGSWAGPNNTW